MQHIQSQETVSITMLEPIAILRRLALFRACNAACRFLVNLGILRSDWLDSVAPAQPPGQFLVGKIIQASELQGYTT